MTNCRDFRTIVLADSDIADLIPGFLENRRNDIEKIKALLLVNDYETIGRLGHSMKGSAGGYGFDEISAIGTRIEHLSKEGNGSGIVGQLSSLSRYLDCVEVVYE